MLEQSCLLCFALLGRVQLLNYAGSKLWLLDLSISEYWGKDPGYSYNEWKGFCCSPQQDLREEQSINMGHLDQNVHSLPARHELQEH